MRSFSKWIVSGALCFIALLIVRQYIKVDPVTSVQSSKAVVLPKSSVVVETQPLVNPSEALKKLREKYGDELQIERAKDGRIISLRLPRVRSANVNRRIINEESAIRRAKEILNSLGQLIQIQRDTPLVAAFARIGEVSTSVYFQESYKGILVAPFGQVSLQMDSAGELLKLESDYLSGLHVENEIKISQEAAKREALDAVAQTAGVNLELNDAGSPLVWVSRESAITQTPAGKFAFQYWIGGVQVVVDAESGAVLYQKNRKRN